MEEKRVDDDPEIDISQLSIEEREEIRRWLRAKAENKTADASETKFQTQMAILTRVITELTENGFIGPANMWKQPDLETSAGVLGLQWTPNLVGRAHEIGDACEKITFEESNRKPLIFFDGIPGTGKTRLLQETAACLIDSSNNADIAVFAVTFNHQQNAIINKDMERKLVEMDVELPVTLRLMHSCMGSSGKAWGSFAAAAQKTIQSIARPSYTLSIGTLLDYLARHFGKSRVLLLVDETLRWLDINLELHQVQAMVSATCQACDDAGRAVLFTAMSTSFLNEEKTESTRAIVAITLGLLSEEDSRTLTSYAIGRAITTLRQLTCLSNDSIISTLDALAVGALPRAAETLKTECQSVGELQRTPASLSSLITRVYGSLSRKYSFPLQLTRLAVLGVPKLNPNHVIPGTSETVERAVLRGWLPKPRRSNMHVSVAIPPMLMLCSLLSEETSGALRTAAYYFSFLSSLSPRNLWEELVLRTLILRTHMISFGCVAKTEEAISQGVLDSSPRSTGSEVGCCGVSSSGAMTASSSPLPSTTIPQNESSIHYLHSCPSVSERSVFAMFHGVRMHPDVPRYPVRRCSTLSNMVLQFRFKHPPMPSELLANPTLMQHLFVSESSVEPGMDALTFRWKGTEQDVTIIAVGIQCKWSSMDASTVLSSSDIVNAYNLFLDTMMALGWTKDQCMLVFLAHRSVASNVFDKKNLVSTLPKNIAVASLENGIEEWLGPTLTKWARCLHTAHISHGPYGPYIPGQGPPK